MSVGVPWKYVEPLLRQNQELPLSVLSSESRRRRSAKCRSTRSRCSRARRPRGSRRRPTPSPRRFGWARPRTTRATSRVAIAIYAETAKKLIDTRDDCAGVQTALRRAWRARDCDERRRSPGVGDERHVRWAVAGDREVPADEPVAAEKGGEAPVAQLMFRACAAPRWLRRPSAEPETDHRRRRHRLRPRLPGRLPQDRERRVAWISIGEALSKGDRSLALPFNGQRDGGASAHCTRGAGDSGSP